MRPVILPLMGLPLAPMTVSWLADSKLFVRGTTATTKGHSGNNDATHWRLFYEGVQTDGAWLSRGSA
jgi:hypothetical protein